MREQIFCAKIIQILRKNIFILWKTLSECLQICGSQKKSERKSPMTLFGSPMKSGCRQQNLGSQ